MRETLIRRVESFDKISPPDLWLLDGGKAQLNLAKEILESAGIDIDILAISKEKIDAKAHRAKGKANDIIYSLNDKFKLPTSDKKLQFLQKLRDESHRFAIEYHRKQKVKEDKEIDLLNIKGIGKAKVVKLINYFGTFENIKNASFEELSKVLNQNDAKNIKALYEN
jgi:excinuclease ABC subunit C